MQSKPNMKVVNKWVTDANMREVVQLAMSVLRTPIKGLSIDQELRKTDADIIADMMLGTIMDKTLGKTIQTVATNDAIREAAKTWFLDYLEQEKPI